MNRRRVVVTGIGLVSPIGNDLPTVSHALRHDQHGIRRMSAWADIVNLDTRLGATADVDLERWPRKQVRTMGRVALLATSATEDAVRMAGLESETLGSGRTGLAYGSTHGSSSAFEQWARAVFANHGMKGITSSAYLQFMSHTCAANLALFFGVKGRVISTCAACVSASQGIGTGYEAIRDGYQDVMICGGAEEMHYTHAGVFDVMFATSRKYNDRPELSPRPFDANRDGLVVGEGAGTLVLEDFERARARGARMYAEVLGYGTNCDGTHVTQPSALGMAGAMRLALTDARLDAAQIDYVNAHATATDVGDIAESEATLEVLGAHVPVSSTKGFTGHTLGACGAIEAAFCIAMMAEGWIAPNRTLERVDPRCAALDYVGRDPLSRELTRTMSNNFAFGGLNTSLVLGRPPTES